ncbi:hypothetical protein Slin15195_G075120 [Septoria linicola]|uniref:Uncharacterized protein n=1 Tax=Septoria linicola TaxID=215465 RepID=A0A9Q9AY50_9PEZI|nr:hypothetical protein Slin15195_G075120 [Septoria linicola]
MSWPSSFFVDMIESVSSLLTPADAGSSSSNAPRSQGQYPRTPEDVSRTVQYLHKASPSHLPAELLTMILSLADYDCIHFSVHADKSVTRRSQSSNETPRLPYIETEPLRYLSSPGSAHSGAGFAGRIRAVRLQVTGKDQGWGGDGSGSWSWFEVASRQSTSTGPTTGRISAGLRWAQNEVASKEWQQHEADLESNEDLGTWASSLKNGDRVSILPMARFPGWACTASAGSIDVEVEVWR